VTTQFFDSAVSLDFNMSDVVDCAVSGLAGRECNIVRSQCK